MPADAAAARPVPGRQRRGLWAASWLVLSAGALSSGCGERAPDPFGPDAPRPRASISCSGGGGAALYGVESAGGNTPGILYGVDPLTGEGAPVGSIGFERISGMAAHPGTSTLFATGERLDGSDTHVLLTVDPFTGAGTEIGPTGIEGFLGFGATLPSPIGRTFTDLAFRSDGTLFGFGYPGEGLATIDPRTGAATQIGYSETQVGVGGNDLGFLANWGNALAFSPSGPLLHAASLDPLTSPIGGPSLHEVDPATSVVTDRIDLVFPAAPDVPDPRVPRPNAMDFHPTSGVLYASIRYGWGAQYGGTPSSMLGTIDTSTGAVALIGPSVDRLDALAWIDLGLAAVGAIQRLLAAVDSLVAAGSLGPESEGLKAKLFAAIYQLELGNIGSTIYQLTAFVGQLSGLMNGSVPQLAQEDGRPLVDAAEALISRLGGCL